jgi:glycosyltransferase involved in cell wall biosynthesis
VTQGIPHPREGASSVIFYEYVRGITGASGPVLHLLLTDRTNRDERLLREYRESMSGFPHFEILDCPVSAMYHVNRWTRMPGIEALPASVAARVGAFDPDVVVCFDVLPAAYAAQVAPAARRVVWLGDLHFQSFWYNALYDIRDRKAAALRLPLIALLCRQWRRFYARVLSGACSVVVSSKSSESAVEAIGVTAGYLSYPWPEKADTGEAAMPPLVPTFALFGSLSGLGSRSSFDTLIREVYPMLLKMWGPGGFRVLLAGIRTAPEWALRAIKERPEMEFVGFVDDLVAFMRGCHAVVVPIAVPVGNRTRILTALAHGALVIAHRNTALGNDDLRSGDTCLLAGTPEEFARHLRFAVDSPVEARAIAERGQAMYQRRFAPAPAVGMFLERIAACAR